MNEALAGMGGFPTPGKALRGVLWAVGGLAVFWAIAVNYVPGGREAFELLIFSSDQIAHHGQVWRLLTAGLLSPPGGPGSVTHVLFTLAGLYFLSPTLESRWGSARFLRFLLASVVAGYALALAIDLLPLKFVHTSEAYGMGAAITAVAVAWSRENANSVVRLFFVIPAKGSTLLWLTIAFCVANVIFHDPSTEGLMSPFGGILVGLVWGGATSPFRTMYLKWKLGSLQRRTGLSAASMLQKPARGKPALRVIRGAADEDSPRREPPRDKRYLN